MITINFVAANGTRRAVEAEPGWSVMEAAVRNDVPGIDADCGGACSCATCRVDVDPAWRERVGGPGDVEVDLLELVDEPNEDSRLSCQIQVDDRLDGLVVHVPD